MKQFIDLGRAKAIATARRRGPDRRIPDEDTPVLRTSIAACSHCCATVAEV